MLNTEWLLDDGLPQDLPWNSTVGLLLDGVSIEKLPQHLYQWTQSPVFEPLYLGTRWAEICDISPCLVQIKTQSDPVLTQFLNACRQEWGYLVFSDRSWDHLVTHFRWLTSVLHPQGEEVLLRIADPAVTRALLVHAQSINDSTLFGPCKHVVTADAAKGCWHFDSRPDDAPETDRGTRYRLDDKQLSVLGEVNFRNVIMRLDQHMLEYFPNYLAHVAPLQRWEQMSALALAAYNRGFNTEADITLYANIHGFLGAQALEDHPDLNALLETSSRQTSTQCIEHIAGIAKDRAERLQRNAL